MNRFLDVHIAREADVFLKFYQLLRNYGDLSDNRNLRRLVTDFLNDHMFKVRLLQRGFEITPDVLLTALAQLERISYPILVESISSQFARMQGKVGEGIKKPSYALHMDEINRLFPTVKIIHIIRDGRDIVLSARNRKDFMGNKNWFYAAKDWRTIF